MPPAFDPGSPEQKSDENTTQLSHTKWFERFKEAK